MSNLYSQNLKSSPARAPSSTNPWNNLNAANQYLDKLLEEKKKLAHAHDLPICHKLLNQEILRVTELIHNQEFDYFDRLQLRSANVSSPLQHQATLQGLPTGQGSSSLITKKLLRVDVPVDRFPDFNFVGRLLGPRGNSLKRIETLTGCRVFIRGRGSMKDPDKEERLRGRPGHGHLNEPLHILIEAESPANVVDVPLRQAKEIIEELLKPVNYSGDLYKKQQLRELAMLNSLCVDDTCQPSSSSGAMKRATTPSGSSSHAQRTTR
ncbi:hypothetical protein L2E82_00519 [Cichorium intybus]|uniref:Uncharacterized protein n=1 Tax=Cichorium intybus TaxID=13427 RepID=A0ACB9GY59_CICIN|nr:hypothetical protein L2E82_00519 [Cichorium intybus]